MAKIYGEIAASGLMTFDKSFSRSNGQPLDSTEVFYSLTAAQDYAKTDVAYVGQKIVVIETIDETTTVTHYGIEADGSLKELGAIPVGDGLTVEVVDGKIQLAALDGHTSGTYQPFLVDGAIEWREPSATTVEGLDTRLTTVEDDIEDLERKAHEHLNKTELDKISEGDKAKWDSMEQNAKDYADSLNTSIDARVKAIEDDYLKAADKVELADDIADNKALIDTLNGNSETVGSVDYKIAQAVAAIMENPDETMNSINELVTWINDHADSALELSNQVTINKNDIAALEKLVGTTGVADQITTAIEEALKIDGVEKYALAIDLTAAIARIATLETNAHTHTNKDLLDAYTQTDTDLADAVAKKHEHKNIDVLDGITADKVTAWDTAEQNAKGYADDLNTAMGVRVGNVETAINDKVNAEDGKSLISNTLIAKLENVEESAQVNKIEQIYIGDTLLDAIEKKVVIPVGAGLKASEEIVINEDNTLGVGTISISKLANDDEVELVLDGGSASQVE